MLYFGGLVMAMTIERSGLHERAALRAMMLFGSDPKWYLCFLFFSFLFFLILLLLLLLLFI
jgi:di/tricarboxylate transporter